MTTTKRRRSLTLTVQTLSLQKLNEEERAPPKEREPDALILFLFTTNEGHNTTT